MSALSVIRMNIPLHGWHEWHGKPATTRSQYQFMFDGMCRFPHTKFPQKGLQNNSSVVSGIPTWVITRILDSHFDDKARFFESVIKCRLCQMERSGSSPCSRIVLPSWTGVNFTQVSRLLSERLVRTSWLGHWLKFHWECRQDVSGPTKYRIRN